MAAATLVLAVCNPKGPGGKTGSNSADGTTVTSTDGFTFLQGFAIRLVP